MAYATDSHAVGLLNSATAFQRYIDFVLTGLDGIHVYMDDILAYAPSIEVIFIQLRLLFLRLLSRTSWLTLDKCKFFKLCIPTLETFWSRDLSGLILLE